jgi:Reverse transcriptase (RNA-dependent DNA polymerase)
MGPLSSTRLAWLLRVSVNVLALYSPQGKQLYCLLLKAIYGLKQGSRQWYLKLSQVMKDLGFKKVRSEPCVYIFLRGDDRVIVAMWTT